MSFSAIIKRILLSFLLCVALVFPAPCTAQNDASKFTFALVTDTHLKQNNPENTNLLRMTVKDINSQQGIDFVIVAGDIADKGDRPSLLTAKQLLDSLYVPYYAIPGNHDTRYCPTATATFDSVFVSHHFAFRHRGWFIIGFNTGRGNGDNSGNVNRKEMNWIGEQLGKNLSEQVIAVTHFPLIDMQVDNAQQVLQLLAPHHTRLILGGHLHRNAVLDCSGIPDLLTRSLQRNGNQQSGYSLVSIGNSIVVSERNPVSHDSFMWMELPPIR
jgi:predicted phosphodiesterase